MRRVLAGAYRGNSDGPGGKHVTNRRFDIDRSVWHGGAGRVLADLGEVEAHRCGYATRVILYGYNQGAGISSYAREVTASFV